MIRDWRLPRSEDGPESTPRAMPDPALRIQIACKNFSRNLTRSGGGREARFVCALALAQEGILLHESQGQCSGIIAGEPQGTGGFGYDPVFFFPSLGKTFAQLNEAEKNQHSHRAQAVAALLKLLR